MRLILLFCCFCTFRLETVETCLYGGVECTRGRHLLQVGSAVASSSNASSTNGAAGLFASQASSLQKRAMQGESLSSDATTAREDSTILASAHSSLSSRVNMLVDKVAVVTAEVERAQMVILLLCVVVGFLLVLVARLWNNGKKDANVDETFRPTLDSPRFESGKTPPGAATPNADSAITDSDECIPPAWQRQQSGSLSNSIRRVNSSKDVAPNQPTATDYKGNDLGSWKAFTFSAQTVWASRLLWNVVGKLLLVSASTAVAVFLLTSHTGGRIDTHQFEVISQFLRVFVAFLLGYFLVNAVARWSDTMDGFLALFDSVRNLVMQLHGLGATRRHSEQCARYGVLSATFLEMDLKHRKIYDRQMRDSKIRIDLNQAVTNGLLLREEVEPMSQIDDHAALVWIWVGMLLGRMAEDGEIPGMASPTYGRLMQEAQSAQAGIRRVRVSVAVQTPFVYVHTLSLLVHTNNILSAISFGCSLGMECGSIVARVFGATSTQEVIGNRTIVGTGVDDGGSIKGDVGKIFMAFITCFVAPLLYQAFLQIGLALSQPIGSELGAIPSTQMIEHLQRDLSHANLLADSVPNFDTPCFNRNLKTVIGQLDEHASSGAENMLTSSKQTRHWKSEPGISMDTTSFLPESRGSNQ